MGPTLNEKTIVLPSSGQPVLLDLAGTFFQCADANQKFEVSFDDKGWTKWGKGFSTEYPFSRLGFRALPGSTDEVTLSFYYGQNVRVTDSRIVFQDGQQAVAFRPDDTFFWKNWPDESWDINKEFESLPTRQTTIGVGPGGSIVFGTFLRAYLEVELRTAAAAGLEVYVRDWIDAAQPKRLIGRVYQGQPPRRFSANSKIYVKNGTGGVVNASLFEVFYTTPVIGWTEKGPELAPEL